jgi:hypothetical protein
MADLGVELIQARSPQAKGRVERRHRVFQDRLVKELRLRNISDMAQANILLEKFMLPEFNKRYAIKPAQAADLHRRPPESIEEVLCVQEPRVVGKDWCVRFANRWLQIENQKGSAGLAGKTVLIKQLADGRLLVLRGKEKLCYRELAWRPKTAPRRAINNQVNNQRYKPSWNHPYNRQARAVRAAKARKTNQEALAA